MKARIVNNTVAEILTAVDGHAIEDCFHPDLLAQCVDVPPEVQVGWVKQEDGTFAAPVVEETSVVEETPVTE